MATVHVETRYPAAVEAATIPSPRPVAKPDTAAGLQSETGIDRYSLRYLEFTTGSPERLARMLLRRPRVQAALPVRLMNTNSLGLARSDAKYAEVITGPGINIPDGAPVRWALRKKYGKAIESSRGPDVFRETLRLGGSETRHYLLGGCPESLPKLEEAIRQEYPHCTIVGSYSPPFRPLTDSERVSQDAAIADARPDFVWVGLGGAKQDIEAARISRELSVMTVGVGAAFDFVAGQKNEAPSWLHGTGLEWMFRLCQEPRRLARRYLKDSNQAALWLLGR